MLYLSDKSYLMAAPSKESQARCHRIYIRVNPFEYAQFTKAKDELGLSARQVLEYLSKPCECSTESEVTMFNKKKSKSITIKKGLLCKRV